MKFLKMYAAAAYYRENFLEACEFNCETDTSIMENDKTSQMPKEGKYRTDKFVVFVYGLVAIMFALQVAIIAWGAVL